MTSTRVPLLYGASTFGRANTNVTRVHELPDCQALLDAYVKEFGGKEIDTARRYGLGSSEEFLSELEVYGARIDSKAPPPLTREGLRQNITASIKALGKHQIRTYYLHAPDRDTPFVETAAAINELHKENLFEEFGLSNFEPEEVTRMHDLCKENGFVLPTVYQGAYNILWRTQEIKLFPILRKLHMRFVGFSPLAGGMLAGNLKSKDDTGAAGGRFDSESKAGQAFRKLYTEGRQFEALDLLNQSIEKHSLTLGETGYRWLQHHSALSPSDGIIIGARTVEQVKANILDSMKGRLPQDVVETIEEMWQMLKDEQRVYSPVST